MSFLLAIFAVIEHLNKSELTTTSKKLIIAYVNEATGTAFVEKARTAVRRYTQTVLPSLVSIKLNCCSTRLKNALSLMVWPWLYPADCA